MNRRAKRLFGLLRVESEFIGYIRDDTFEVWDRYRHAVHAYGHVKGRRGGTRIELSASLTQRTVVFMALFFALYAVAAVELGSDSPVGLLPALLIAVAGALVTAGIFVASARSQKAQLGRFVRGIFREELMTIEEP
jgi:heme/copper-type cytochrome/quinol oxidase subunit 3